jgi:hypothetical protein
MTNFLELLRDPAWQFVGAVIGLAALVAMFLVYWLQRQRKAIAYEVVSKNQLLTVREELEGRLQVMYEGQPARDICLLVLKLLNTGNVAIATADYERPVSFSTGPSSKILSAAVTEVDPDNLVVVLKSEESRVVIEPVLLNSKDSITLKLLVSDFSGTISTDGRIIGVKAIEHRGETTGYHTLLMAFFVICIAIGVYLTIGSVPVPTTQPPMPIKAKVGMTIFLSGYIGLVVVMLKTRRFRNIFVRAVRRLRGELEPSPLS